MGTTVAENSDLKTFYVAGKFQDYIRVRNTVDFLTKLGNKVTFDWTRTDEFGLDGEPVNQDPHDIPLEKLRGYANDDLKGAQEADFLVVLADQPLFGAWIEMGAALASEKCKKIFVVKPERWTIFLEHEKVRVFHTMREWVKFANENL